MYHVSFLKGFLKYTCSCHLATISVKQMTILPLIDSIMTRTIFILKILNRLDYFSLSNTSKCIFRQARSSVILSTITIVSIVPFNFSDKIFPKVHIKSVCNDSGILFLNLFIYLQNLYSALFTT